MATTLLAAGVKNVSGQHSSVTSLVKGLPHIRTNVSSAERTVSAGIGGTLAVLGFDGRGPTLPSLLASGALFYRAMTGNCPLYQAVGFSTSDATSPNSVIAAGHGTRVEHSVIVQRPVGEVYRFWRDFENLPRFMAHLVDVNTSTDGRSHWIARGPLGFQMEWEAELISDFPNDLIAWRSLDGADVDTAGSVRFRELPGGRGTAVEVNLKYDPPAGKLGTFVAKLVGQSPDRQIAADLRRFKQIMEAGEIPTTKGQSSGRSKTTIS